MQEKKSDSANKNPKKGQSPRPPLHQTHTRRVRHRDRDGPRICGGRAAEQCEAVSGHHHHRHRSLRSVLQEEVPRKPRFSHPLHRLIYIVFNALLQLIIFTKEKNAILFTHPPADSFTSTGLVVSSKLPRFSDMYTLVIASSDAKSISANQPVQFTKSVTQWFTRDGVLVEGLLWKDVEALINEYQREPKKSK